MKINDFINSFIPLHIPNRIVVNALDIMRIFTTPFMTKAKINENKNHNINEISKTNSKIIPNRFIENQVQLGDIAFGKGKHTNMSYSGCEIISVYNALLSIGEEVSGDFIVRLISHFEKNGSVLNGEFGTSPKALYRYFKKNDYNTSITYSLNDNKINNMGQTHDTFIATFYNDKLNIQNMIHTVCISKNKHGGFVAHNAYKKDKNGNYIETPEADTLIDTINGLGSNPKLICMISIKNKSHETFYPTATSNRYKHKTIPRKIGVWFI
jgi:hypothetical protein